MPKVLIVDDDNVSRSILREMLRQEGMTVLEARDGNECLEVFRADPCDLIITDIFMPGKEGLQTIKELRAAYPTVKIIAISGGSSFTSFECLRWAKNSGADHAIQKPFQREEVLATVRMLLG